MWGRFSDVRILMVEIVIDDPEGRTAAPHPGMDILLEAVRRTLSGTVILMIEHVERETQRDTERLFMYNQSQFQQPPSIEVSITNRREIFSL